MENDVVHRMFEHACAFADCAEHCEVESNSIKCRTKSHTVSGIVNSAFACEVFIKTLLVYQGVPVSELREQKYGHKLKELWNELKKEGEETAPSVEQKVQAWFNSQDEDLFSQLLDEASNAFEYWRYIYEKANGSLNPNFLRVFRYSLRNICCEYIHGKTWDEYIGDCRRQRDGSFV